MLFSIIVYIALSFILANSIKTASPNRIFCGNATKCVVHKSLLFVSLIYLFIYFTNLFFGLLSTHPITPLISLLQEVQNNAKSLTLLQHGLFITPSWLFRYPIGSHVVGALILPCGNCFFCSMVISLWDATLYLVQFFTIVFNAVRTTLINAIIISFIF